MKKPTLFVTCTLLLLASCTGDSFRDHVRRGNRNYLEATDTLNQDSTHIYEASTEYERAIDKDSTIAIAHYNAGNTYLLTGQDSTAFREYMRADSLESDYARQAHIHRNIGVLLQSQSLTAPDSTKNSLLHGAVVNYKASLRYDPTNDETRYNLALCQWQLRQNNDSEGSGGQGEDNSQQKDDQSQQQNQQQSQQGQQQQEQQNQQQKQQEQKQQQQQQASEQMIQAAMQREKETQNRMNMYDRAKRQEEDAQEMDAHPRRLQKNW